MILLFQDPGTAVLLLDPLLWVCGGTAVAGAIAAAVYWLVRRRR